MVAPFSELPVACCRLPVVGCRLSVVQPQLATRNWQLATGNLSLHMIARGVLLVGHVVHPLDALAVERLDDGDVRHRRGPRGAVPVLLAGRTPDDVAGPDLHDRASLALHQTASGG